MDKDGSSSKMLGLVLTAVVSAISLAIISMTYKTATLTLFVLIQPLVMFANIMSHITRAAGLTRYKRTSLRCRRYTKNHTSNRVTVRGYNRPLYRFRTMNTTLPDLRRDIPAQHFVGINTLSPLLHWLSLSKMATQPQDHGTARWTMATVSLQKARMHDGSSRRAVRGLLFVALCFMVPRHGGAHCSLSNTALTALEGTLSDGSGDARYDTNLDCSWIIAPPRGHGALSITFTEFSVYLWHEDIVSVYSCESEACEQPELLSSSDRNVQKSYDDWYGIYVSNGNPAGWITISFPTGIAKITFTSDDQEDSDSDQQGFSATWTV
eukprot:1028848-Rhodomonas_salina.3